MFHREKLDLEQIEERCRHILKEDPVGYIDDQVGRIACLASDMRKYLDDLEKMRTVVKMMRENNTKLPKPKRKHK